MSTNTPKTISEYLDQLRYALRSADPALIQDALYDAEEHLRSEMAENPDVEEATLLARIATSYGAPEEVADIYRVKEAQVEQALRPPAIPTRTSLGGRFFGVFADPYAYAALFYMLLSLVTGIFYFTWVVTGMSLSIGLMVLIIGLPFAVLFLGTVRALSLIEGRLVEVMLNVRMPRRPVYADKGKPFLTRVKDMIVDPRTWSTLLYMLLKLPLGVFYFATAVISLTFSIMLILVPVVQSVMDHGIFNIDGATYYLPLWATPITLALGVLALCLTLHFARGVGYFQGQLAKHLLVKSAS